MVMAEGLPHWGVTILHAPGGILPLCAFSMEDLVRVVWSVKQVIISSIIFPFWSRPPIEGLSSPISPKSTKWSSFLLTAVQSTIHWWKSNQVEISGEGGEGVGGCVQPDLTVQSWVTGCSWQSSKSSFNGCVPKVNKFLLIPQTHIPLTWWYKSWQMNLELCRILIISSCSCVLMTFWNIPN